MSVWARGPRRLLKELAPPAAKRGFNRLKLVRARRRELRRLVQPGGASPSVTYLTDYGLANRMRAHVMAWDFARRTDRTLAVNWAVTAQCAARFDDLFVRGASPRTVSGRVYLSHYDRASDVASHDLLDDVRHEAFVLDIGWQAISREPFLRRLANRTPDARSALIPHPALVAQVDAVAAQWPQRVVGVHVRRGDFVTHANQAVPLRRYITALNQVLADARLSDAAIFLASDGSDDELRLLLDTYGERIVRRPASPRTSVEGVRSALVDLLLLSRTDYLVLTPRSTFGEMAAFLGDVPFVAPHTSP